MTLLHSGTISSLVRSPIRKGQYKMDLAQRQYAEGPLVKTKIVATVGPASASYEKLTELVLAGVDVFRLNFAHGSYDWFKQVVGWIRRCQPTIISRYDPGRSGGPNPPANFPPRGIVVGRFNVEFVRELETVDQTS